MIFCDFIFFKYYFAINNCFFLRSFIILAGILFKWFLKLENVIFSPYLIEFLKYCISRITFATGLKSNLKNFSDRQI